MGIYSASSLVTDQNLRIPVNGINWQVSDSMGNVLPSDVFEVLESTERVRRDRLGIIGDFFLVSKAHWYRKAVQLLILAVQVINDPWKRGSATHEIYFSVETSPMNMVTVNIKKASLTFDAKNDIKGDNSITNGDITLTFGQMGVETLNGKPFTNELLWFNSSQGAAIIRVTLFMLTSDAPFLSLLSAVLCFFSKRVREGAVDVNIKRVTRITSRGIP